VHTVGSAKLVVEPDRGGVESEALLSAPARDGHMTAAGRRCRAPVGSASAVSLLTSASRCKIWRAESAPTIYAAGSEGPRFRLTLYWRRLLARDLPQSLELLQSVRRVVPLGDGPDIRLGQQLGRLSSLLSLGDGQPFCVAEHGVYHLQSRIR
jgi:hypothetical protein